MPPLIGSRKSVAAIIAADCVIIELLGPAPYISTIFWLLLEIVLVKFLVNLHSTRRICRNYYLQLCPHWMLSLCGCSLPLSITFWHTSMRQLSYYKSSAGMCRLQKIAQTSQYVSEGMSCVKLVSRRWLCDVFTQVLNFLAWCVVMAN